MTENFDTKPISSNCVVGATRLATKHEYTTTMILCKIIKIALGLLVLLLTFWAGDFRGWERREALIQRCGVYVYGTQQEIENYYTMRERDFFNKTGFFPESCEAREMIASIRSERPLVVVGPFAVFVDNNGGKFSVRERQSIMPLVELEIHEQSKRLFLVSSIEKGCIVPRFTASLNYTEDGIYEKSGFSVHRENGTLERIYIDTKGIGIFDIMRVYENGVQFIYRLNDLTWEKIAEEPYSSTLINVENMLSPYNELLKNNDSNENEELRGCLKIKLYKNWYFCFHLDSETFAESALNRVDAATTKCLPVESSPHSMKSSFHNLYSIAGSCQTTQTNAPPPNASGSPQSLSSPSADV